MVTIDPASTSVREANELIRRYSADGTGVTESARAPDGARLIRWWSGRDGVPLRSTGMWFHFAQPWSLRLYSGFSSSEHAMHHLRGHPMQTTKEAARQAIDRLPDQATWEDIMYELYVKQKIEAGLRAAEEGRTIAHEEMKRRISAKKRHAKSAGLPICTAGGCPEGVRHTDVPHE